MTDDDLRKLLSAYRCPEPSAGLEARLLAKVSREGSARPLAEEPEVLAWPTLAYAGALSVLLAVATGYWYGITQCRGVMATDSVIGLES